MITPVLAGHVMKRARRLLRAGALRAVDLAVMDCLAWSCRDPRRDDLAVSYRRLAQLVRVAKGTVIRSVARLVRAGLLARQKRGRLVRWANGGCRFVQVANAYRLLLPPDCEFNSGTAFPEQGERKSFEASVARRFDACPPIRSVAEQLALLRGG